MPRLAAVVLREEKSIVLNFLREVFEVVACVLGRGDGRQQ